jgi:hypothetical protein
MLRNEISPECVCVLDGINWDNPPKSPADLSQDWELIEDEKSVSNRFIFKHKDYPKIRIGFDEKDKNGKEKPHWHRENPDLKSKKYRYLDKDGNTVMRNTPNSHIYVKTKK